MKYSQVYLEEKWHNTQEYLEKRNIVLVLLIV